MALTNTVSRAVVKIPIEIGYPSAEVQDNFSKAYSIREKYIITLVTQITFK